MKEKGIEFSIQWKFIARAKPYSPATGRCHLRFEGEMLHNFPAHMAS